MLLKIFAKVTLAGLVNVQLAWADELDILKAQAAISSTVAYTPQNMNLALIRSFALKDDSLTLPGIFALYGVGCTDKLQNAEYSDKNWLIKSSWDPDRPSEIQVTVAGPAQDVSNFAPVGYEWYVFQIFLHFDVELNLQPYIYYRTSRYNLRSLEELKERKHRDNVVMDPYEQWSDNFLPRLNSAISEVVEYRLAECSTESQEMTVEKP